MSKSFPWDTDDASLSLCMVAFSYVSTSYVFSIVHRRSFLTLFSQRWHYTETYLISLYISTLLRSNLHIYMYAHMVLQAQFI